MPHSNPAPRLPVLVLASLVSTTACGSGEDGDPYAPPPSHDASEDGQPDGAIDAMTDGSPDSSWPDSNPADGGAGSGPDAQPTDGSVGQDVSCPPTCDDGNPCNGVETCDPATGTCQAGQPIACDDGDPCNGVETCDPATGSCVGEVFPACPAAPPECNQTGGSGPTAGKVTAAEAGGFRLYDEDRWSASEGIIGQIASHASAKLVTLGEVLANLNRTATKVSNVSGTECFHTGFAWNGGDNDVTYWYPQGITGTGDAYASGDYQGRKVGIVSWYHKPENDSSTSENKGVRVAIYDVTDMNSIQYRLALLVTPVMDGATPTFEAVPLHAGGLVWYGNYLYVADTSRGFRVFDLTRILEVNTGNANWLGKISEADGYHAYNYRYAIPEVGQYRKCTSSCCARFSFVSLDRSTSPHSLLAGEYSASNVTGRMHRWPLDETTGRLLVVGGRVQASDAVFPGVGNIQGGFSWNGTYFASCSGSYLGLHVGAVGQSTAKRGWPYGPEDLHYAPASDNLWSLTEHPGSRYVFAVKRASIQSGCN